MIDFNWTDIDLEERNEQSDPLTWNQTDSNWEKLQRALNIKIAPAIEGIILLLPQPGDMRMFAGANNRLGWLKCDGAAVSRAGYQNLFTAIGTNYGTGDGSTTFNIPDMRGRIPMGSGLGPGLTNRSLGQTPGVESTTHDHNITIDDGGPSDITVSGTTDDALGPYTPDGNIVMDLYTPEGDLNIPDITPSGLVQVDAIAVDFNNTTVSGVIEEAAPHTHDVTIPPMGVTYGEAPANDPAAPDTYTTTGYQVNIDLSIQPIVFGGNQVLNPTASFTGDDLSVPGTFQGTPKAPTGVFNGTEEDLGHNHTFEAIISASSLEHDHNASSNEKTLTTIQPSTVLNYFIKT